MRLLTIFLAVFLISACTGTLKKEQPICTGTAFIGGQESTVNIYKVRNIAGQTQYRAGYPFNWQWVGKNNFIRTTCS
ncbi:phage exclusion lipoprotein Cor [Kluyvera intermedia]|uniref:phage exclusion lipoprotein Cor n=1 Tax=Kluyvera intermedia TaxID=61648 RepID=UPI00372D3EBC